MKKLIAVSVALALVAGSAFAELRVSGDVEVGLNLVQGNNADGPGDDSWDPVGFGPFARGRLRLDGEVDTGMGTFGAMLRFDGRLTGGAPRLHGVDLNAWWMPMEMLWVGMGNAMGALGGLGRQGFYRAGDTVGWLNVNRAGAIYHSTAFSDDFATGLAVDLRLLDDTVRIGVGLPYQFTGMGGDFSMAPTGANVRTVESIFRGLFVRAYMDLDGIGRLGFAFDGQGRRTRGLMDQFAGFLFDEDDNVDDDRFDYGAIDGDIFAFFSSSELVDGLGLDFSVRFGLGRSGIRNPADGNLEYTAVANNLAIGAGVNFDLDDQFGVRFRATAAFTMFADNEYIPVPGDLSDENVTALSFEILPHFMITPDVMFGLYAGLGFHIGSGDDDDMNLQWAVNPHVRVNMGAPSFVFGFHAWGNNNGNSFDNDGDGMMGWAIPMALIFNF